MNIYIIYHTIKWEGGLIKNVYTSQTAALQAAKKLCQQNPNCPKYENYETLKRKVL